MAPAVLLGMTWSGMIAFLRIRSIPCKEKSHKIKTITITLHTINNVTPCFKRCSPVFTMRFVYERWAWGPFTPIALVALLG